MTSTVASLKLSRWMCCNYMYVSGVSPNGPFTLIDISLSPPPPSMLLPSIAGRLLTRCVTSHARPVYNTVLCNYGLNYHWRCLTRGRGTGYSQFTGLRLTVQYEILVALNPTDCSYKYGRTNIHVHTGREVNSYRSTYRNVSCTCLCLSSPAAAFPCQPNNCR